MAGQATVIINDTVWNCDVASLPNELLAGLAGVSSIPAGTGMLFDFGSGQSEFDVTTVDMLFNIDIVFMSADGIVLGVASNVEPGRTVNFTAADVACRYFMEVNAGEIAAAGVAVGDEAVIGTSTPVFNISSIVELMVVVGMAGIMAKTMIE